MGDTRGVAMGVVRGSATRHTMRHTHFTLVLLYMYCVSCVAIRIIAENRES